MSEEGLAETGLAVTRISEPRITSGATLGRYVIKDVLGAGGMGVVYRAHDPELGRLIALKVVNPGERDLQQSQSSGRLVREAQAMARVAHPNVIVVHDAGTVGAQVFVAMELVDGQDLAAWEQAEPRPWRDVVAVYTQAARGLAAAHDAGLVHRDFKPANALVARDGRVRVLDFGLARTLEATATAEPLAQTAASGPRHAPNQLTQTGAVMGTPQFMSPEQHFGNPADARSDQFNLCVALYHALYARYPFLGKTYAELAAAVTDGDPAPPPRRASVPAAVAKVVMRGLERDPAQRFPATHDLVAALEAAMPRKRWPLLAAAAIAGVAVAVAVVVVVLARRPANVDAPIAMAFATNQQPVTHNGAGVGSPALSPDGHTFAYTTQDGFVLRDLATGTSVDIRESRIVWDLRWSPTGDRLLSATEHGAVIRKSDGTELRIIPFFGAECRAAWSPDATEILWHCDSEPTFTLIDASSAKTRALTIKLPTNERVTDFDWSTGGIVISTSGTNGGALHLARADGSDVRKLADDREIASVRWNARGTRAYYLRAAASGFEIVYRDTKAAGAKPVVVLVQPLGQFALEPLFALARDERSLVYLQRRLSEDAAQVSLPPTSPRQLTADGQPKNALAIAPDQKAIAFAAGTLGAKRLFHLTIGGAPVELHIEPGEYRATAFAPTGKEVATIVMRDRCELWVVPVGAGAARQLTAPAFHCERVDWLPSGQIAVMQDVGHNLILVDPAANTAAPMWPTDTADDLRWYALSSDGKRLAASVPADESTALVAVDVATREAKVMSPTSSMLPIGWSDDGAWIYGIEQPSDDHRPRVIAVSSTGTGASRLVHVLSPGSGALVQRQEAGVIWFPRTNTMDYWLASIDPRPVLPRGPPAAPPQAPAPLPFHAAPMNLALAGPAGAVPEGWEVSGLPKLPALTSECGRPGTCVVLDGDSRGAVYQRIDATLYRGKRIRVRADLRVQGTTAVVVIDSGVYARSEVPSGQLRVRNQGWEKREMFADVTPDAIYIELKLVVINAGTAWVGGVELELAK